MMHALLYVRCRVHGQRDLGALFMTRAKRAHRPTQPEGAASAKAQAGRSSLTLAVV
jgi:hypothetical protein